MRYMQNLGRWGNPAVVLFLAVCPVLAVDAGISPVPSPGVGDYVQGGLLLNYDAICNAGADAAHDGSATNWVNLGSGGALYDLHLSATNRPPRWSDDGFRFDRRMGSEKRPQRLELHTYRRGVAGAGAPYVALAAQADDDVLEVKRWRERKVAAGGTGKQKGKDST